MKSFAVLALFAATATAGSGREPTTTQAPGTTHGRFTDDDAGKPTQFERLGESLDELKASIRTKLKAAEEKVAEAKKKFHDHKKAEPEKKGQVIQDAKNELADAQNLVKLLQSDVFTLARMIKRYKHVGKRLGEPFEQKAVESQAELEGVAQQIANVKSSGGALGNMDKKEVRKLRM